MTSQPLPPRRIRWELLVLGLLGLVMRPERAAAQQDTPGLFIPKDDASPFEWPTTHVWVGDTARLAARLPGELLTVSATNGRAFLPPADADSATCRLIPATAGPVRVRTTQRIRLDGGRSHIVSAVDSFVAIPRPALRLVVDQQQLTRRQVELRIVEARTGHPAPARYEIGRLLPTIYILNPRRRRVAAISPFGPGSSYRLYLVPGNVLQIPAVVIRDQQTDLLLSTPAFEYRIR